MIKHCIECGTKLKKGHKFCQNCGSNIPSKLPEKIKHCPDCGNKIQEGHKFCDNCGFKSEEKKKMFKWVNAKLGVAIMVAIVIIIAIVVFFHINSM